MSRIDCKARTLVVWALWYIPLLTRRDREKYGRASVELTLEEKYKCDRSCIDVHKTRFDSKLKRYGT